MGDAGLRGYEGVVVINVVDHLARRCWFRVMRKNVVPPLSRRPQQNTSVGQKREHATAREKLAVGVATTRRSVAKKCKTLLYRITRQGDDAATCSPQPGVLGFSGAG